VLKRRLLLFVAPLVQFAGSAVPAAAASMLTITMTAVAVVVMMPSLFGICVALHQLFRCGH
jgi:type IV secretory pathway VirB3-like protein